MQAGYLRMLKHQRVIAAELDEHVASVLLDMARELTEIREEG